MRPAMTWRCAVLARRLCLRNLGTVHGCPAAVRWTPSCVYRRSAAHRPVLTVHRALRAYSTSVADGSTAPTVTESPIDYRKLDESRLEEVIELVVNHFFSHIPQWKAVASLPGGGPEENRPWLRTYLYEDLKEYYPLCIVGVEKATDRVVAVHTNVMLPGPNPLRSMVAADTDAARLVGKVGQQLWKGFDPLKEMKVEKCIRMVTGVTHAGFRRRGIMEEMIRRTQEEICPAFGCRALVADCNVHASYMMCLSNGFQPVRKLRLLDSALTEDPRADLSCLKPHHYRYVMTWTQPDN